MISNAVLEEQKNAMLAHIIKLQQIEHVEEEKQPQNELAAQDSSDDEI